MSSEPRARTPRRPAVIIRPAGSAETAATGVTATGPGGSGRPLTEVYDAVLLDLDGVVYRGESAVEHAAEVLAELRGRDLTIGYVTNNAARTPEQVAAHLRQLGIPAAPADVVTSAQAGAGLVAELVPEGAAVLAVGGDGIVEAIKERGLRPVSSLADSPAAVIQGYGPEVGWPQLAEASYAVEAGLPWIATNMDSTLPTARGIAPGNGTLVAAVVRATGVTPVVAGKPEPPLYRESVRRLGATRPLVVGDRLETDIEGARRIGADSLLVLTGVTSPAGLVAAGAPQRPTYLSADLRGLLLSHPPVEVDGDGRASCRQWDAEVREAVTIEGSGDPLDGLRALCGASWSSGREPDMDQLSAAVTQLGL